MAENLKVGDTVKIRGGCPHAWVVYAFWPWGGGVHIHRWDEERKDFVAKTFVDPVLLIKV